MQHVGRRPSGRNGFYLWLVLVVFAQGLALTDTARADGSHGAPEEARTATAAHIWLPESEKKPAVLAFRPRQGAGRRPIAVMLHGMCDAPERECPYFASSVSAFGWLVCPRARLRCSGGGTLWSWNGNEETVEAAVERIEQREQDTADGSQGRILIGFSQGALAAMDIAHHGGGRWERLLLIGAKVYPNATLLKRAGVKRVLLASGDRDMMRWHMQNQARLLDRHGIPTKFMSMGPVGHGFAPDMNAWMVRALAWLQRDDSEQGAP